jgi:class 3 adenylate cyclase
MTSRTCTILFTDLVGSTELRSRLGDDAFDARRQTHDRLLTDAIGRHGGELVKHEGDGVMAVFSSAADALSSASAMQRGLEREGLRHDAPFVARVGVSAGDVMEEGGDYHGTPVVEAARLCNAATGGQILAADVVRVLAGSRGSHQLVPVGDLELKGLPDRVVAWEVEWSGSDGGADLSLRLKEIASRGACVGRDRELDQVVTAWKGAKTGERRLVLVVGEPGIGKTRLSAELAARVVAEGGIALYGWCDEDLGVPYQPWIQALGSFVRACSDADLERLAGHGLEDLARLIPELAVRTPGVASPAAVDAEWERARLFDAIELFVERASTRQPLLFVLDDLHWADQPTLALLRRLLRSDRSGAVLVVATYRDTDVDRRHPLAAMLADLRRDPRATRVVLGGLDRAGLGEMLGERAGHAAPPDFVQVLHEATEGNPFFVEEVVAHLVETGVIYQRDEEWTSDLTAEELGLPEGVRDVVGRRLSLLPDTANDLITVAAVMGREFDLAALVAVSDADRDAVLDALEAALDTGLVTDVPNSSGRFSFSHALVRQTLLEEVRGPRRARLHWRIGEALAKEHDPPLSAIAFHLCEGVLAGGSARAAEAALLAAEHAASVAAIEEATALSERAISVLVDANIDEPELRCRALLVLGDMAASEAQDLVGARARVRAAADLAQRHAWPDLAARAVVVYRRLLTPGVSNREFRAMATAALNLGASTAWRPALQAIVGNEEFADGNWDAGSALIDEAVAAADATDPVSRVLALHSRMNVGSGSPDLAHFSTMTEVFLAEAKSAGSAWWVISAHMNRALAALRAGDRTGFERERASAAALEANTVTHPVATLLSGTAALLDGRFDDAERKALDLLATTDPASVDSLSAIAQLGVIFYWCGRDDELLSAMDVFPTEQRPQRFLRDVVRVSTLARRGERDPVFDTLAEDDFATLPRGWLRPGALCHASYTAAWLGDRERAQILEPLVSPYAGQLLCAPGPSLVFEPADSVRGMLLMTLERVDDAVGAFEAAAASCENAADVPHGVMNLHRLAGALLARDRPGDRDRARILASDARENARALGMMPDVHFAEAVLDVAASP